MKKNKFNRTQIYADNRRNKKDAMRIALSDFLCTSVSKKQLPIQEIQSIRYLLDADIRR